MLGTQSSKVKINSYNFRIFVLITMCWPYLGISLAWFCSLHWCLLLYFSTFYDLNIPSYLLFLVLFFFFSCSFVLHNLLIFWNGIGLLVSLANSSFRTQQQMKLFQKMTLLPSLHLLCHFITTKCYFFVSIFFFLLDSDIFKTKIMIFLHFGP